MPHQAMHMMHKKRTDATLHPPLQRTPHAPKRSGATARIMGGRVEENMLQARKRLRTTHAPRCQNLLTQLAAEIPANTPF